VYTISGKVELRAISKIHAVLDSGICVSDGEIIQIQFVIFGEVVTERMCSSGLASEFQRGVEWEETKQYKPV